MSEVIPRGSLVYLASPYTLFEGGIDAAFEEATRIAAKLLRAGIAIYSPITHSHYIAKIGQLDPLDHSIWLPFNEAMLSRSDILIVAHMDGWDESFGVAEEIKFFETAKRPIFDLYPITFVMSRRQHVRPERERYDGQTDTQLNEDRDRYLDRKPSPDVGPSA